MLQNNNFWKMECTLKYRIWIQRWIREESLCFSSCSLSLWFRFKYCPGGHKCRDVASKCVSDIIKGGSSDIHNFSHVSDHESCSQWLRYTNYDFREETPGLSTPSTRSFTSKLYHYQALLWTFVILLDSGNLLEDFPKRNAKLSVWSNRIFSTATWLISPNWLTAEGSTQIWGFVCPRHWQGPHHQMGLSKWLMN